MGENRFPSVNEYQGHNKGYGIRDHRTGIRDHRTAMGSGIKISKIVGSLIKVSKSFGIRDQKFGIRDENYGQIYGIKVIIISLVTTLEYDKQCQLWLE